jgi:sulfoxide reductase heme-binding subunit YedZ
VSRKHENTAARWWGGWSLLQASVHVAACLPALGIAWSILTDDLTANPVQALEQRTGKAALVLLVLSLSCTPAHFLTGYRPILKLRRPLGLYALLYAVAHFTIFLGVDYAFDLRLIWADVYNKAFIFVGLTAGILLLTLGATSFPWAMRRLGKNWKRLHRLVYVAGLLVVVHYAWAKKGDVFTLRGDILQPLLFAALVFLLLLVRVPAIKRWILNMRQARAGDPTPSSSL